MRASCSVAAISNSSIILFAISLLLRYYVPQLLKHLAADVVDSSLDQTDLTSMMCWFWMVLTMRTIKSATNGVTNRAGHLDQRNSWLAFSEILFTASVAAGIGMLTYGTVA
jgi:hypothetical protein